MAYTDMTWLRVLDTLRGGSSRSTVHHKILTPVGEMTAITFDEFTDALARPLFRPKGAGLQRLYVPNAPQPFVKPSLESESEVAALGSEVIFVEASAAVGKSTTANFISAELGIPILDLSKVPVSTGSLRTLLLELNGIGDAVQAFLRGELPIIVDALDEGRLLSNETGFEHFLTTTGELLMQDRSVTSRPKLIFFGRFESTELAKFLLEYAAPNLVTASVRVDFFGQSEAKELINAYATISAVSDSAYFQHSEPVRQLIAAYFDAIESALGVSAGELWNTEHGRAFAGYAPVLAAVGSLLSQMDNYIEVANRLKSAGAQEAWEVIEAVLSEILYREKKKLCDKLQAQAVSQLPEAVYGPDEQLALLAQYVDSQRLEGTGRVSLPASDSLRYQSMVEQLIPDHPFVRQREYGNAVLGSVVMAQAIANGLTTNSGGARLALLSRQPFIWRSISHRLNRDSLVDGILVGYIFQSFWNDPITARLSDSTIYIRPSNDSDAAIVYIPISLRRCVEFLVTLPLKFYGHIKNCDAEVPGRVVLEGSGSRGTGTNFYLSGSVVLICSRCDVVSDGVRIEGKAWLEADEVSTPSNLNLRAEGADVGWGGQFAKQFPWSRIRSTLLPPYTVRSGDLMTRLIRECSRRFPDGVSVTLNPDFSPAPDDPYMRWVAREFSDEFKALIRVMLDYGIASSEAVPAAGRGKIRIRFSKQWDVLLQACQQPTQYLELKAFVDALRRAVDR